MSKRYSPEVAQKMVHNAIRMAGRSLDLTTKADYFQWEDMAEGLIIYWKHDSYDYPLMVEMEKDLVRYCQETLITYAHDVIVGGGL